MIAVITFLFQGPPQEKGFVGSLSQSNDGKFLKLYVRNIGSKPTKIYRPDPSSFVVSCASCTLRWPIPKNMIEPLRVPPAQDDILPFSCKMYAFSFRQLVPTRLIHKLSIRVVDETPGMFPSHDSTVQLLSTSQVKPFRLTLKNFQAIVQKQSAH